MQNIENRNIVLCLILSVLTCGVYSIYWLYKLTSDIYALDGNTKDNPGTEIVLVILTCGLYGFYLWYKIGRSLSSIKAKQGYLAVTDITILFIILSVFNLDVVSLTIAQSELNNLIQ